MKIGTRLALIVSLVLETGVLRAEDRPGEAYFWNHPHTQLEPQKVTLTGLLEGSRLESPALRVVYARQNTAIEIDSSWNSRRSQNVYYHLSFAWDWMKRHYPDLISPETHGDRQLIVRLDISDEFSDGSHWFAVEEKNRKYNTALSIPGSTSAKTDETEAWAREIWFRPARHLPSQGGLARSVDAYRQAGIIQSIYGSLVLSAGVEGVRRSQVLGNARGFLSSGIDCATSVLALELFFRGTKAVDRSFPSHRFREVSLIPEVIYHEAAHIALAEQINIAHDSPLAEGLANYFAAKMLGSPQLMKRDKEWNRGSPIRNGESNTRYDPSFETRAKAQGNFAFQLLWSMGEALGPSENAVFARAIPLLTSQSELGRDVPRAFFEAVSSEPNAETLRLKLQKVFAEAGL